MSLAPVIKREMGGQRYLEASAREPLSQLVASFGNARQLAAHELRHQIWLQRIAQFSHQLWQLLRNRQTHTFVSITKTLIHANLALHCCERVQWEERATALNNSMRERHQNEFVLEKSGCDVKGKILCEV